MEKFLTATWRHVAMQLPTRWHCDPVTSNLTTEWQQPIPEPHLLRWRLRLEHVWNKPPDNLPSYVGTLKEFAGRRLIRTYRYDYYPDTGVLVVTCGAVDRYRYRVERADDHTLRLYPVIELRGVTSPVSPYRQIVRVQ